MSRRKPDRPYQYDYVKIIEPNFFVRCGYPLTTKILYKEMFEGEGGKKNKEAIEKMLEHFGFGANSSKFIKHGEPLLFGEDFLEDDNLHGLAEEIAYKIAREFLPKRKWGGKERLIYTQTIENLRGKTFLIEGTKMCWTGVRCPASGGYDCYYGGEEYDPPYLDNAKAHRILKLSNATAYTNATQTQISEIYSFDMPSLMIEDCFVKKVNKNEILVES